MSRFARPILCLPWIAAALLLAAPSMAQQVTGTLGSPSATTSISGKQLPAPDPKFGGEIKNDALQSKAVVGAAHRAARQVRPTCS